MAGLGNKTIPDDVDVLIVGAGFSGTALAAYLYESGRRSVYVANIESAKELRTRTAHTGTAASAALDLPVFGTSDAAHDLVQLSRKYFEDPSRFGVNKNLVQQSNGAILLGHGQTAKDLKNQFGSATSLKKINVSEAQKLCADFSADPTGMVFAKNARSLNLRGFLEDVWERHKNKFWFDLKVTAMRFDEAKGKWCVRLTAQQGYGKSAQIWARQVVNAAGQYLDEVQGMAGLPRLGNQVLRRDYAVMDIGRSLKDFMDWPIMVSEGQNENIDHPIKSLDAYAQDHGLASWHDFYCFPMKSKQWAGKKKKDAGVLYFSWGNEDEALHVSEHQQAMFHARSASALLREVFGGDMGDYRLRKFGWGVRCKVADGHPVIGSMDDAGLGGKQFFVSGGWYGSGVSGGLAGAEILARIMGEEKMPKRYDRISLSPGMLSPLCCVGQAR